MNNTFLHNERELILQVSEGDEKAFYTIYSFYAPRLRAYIRKFTHSAADTEELIQESFMRVWLSRDKLPAVLHFQAWMYRLTANNCMKYLRKLHNEEKKIMHLASSANQENLPEDPLDTLQIEDLRRTARQAIAELSDTRRKIYRMSREEGLQPGEIAAQLGIPVGTVKNNLTAASKEIRDYLEKAGYHLPLFFLALIRLF